MLSNAYCFSKVSHTPQPSPDPSFKPPHSGLSMATNAINLHFLTKSSSLVQPLKPFRSFYPWPFSSPSHCAAALINTSTLTPVSSCPSQT